MFWAVLASGMVVLLLTLAVLLRALRYLRLHPELTQTPIPVSYIRCQRTLAQVIERFRALERGHVAAMSLDWESPGGFSYTISEPGIDQRRGAKHRHYLPWHAVGGVGVRMQPGFRHADRNRDGFVDSRYTVGYAFYLLVVPVSGHTMSIQIPTDGSADAIEFTALLLALAQHHRKRINVFGFNKPPAPHRQRVPKF